MQLNKKPLVLYSMLFVLAAFSIQHTAIANSLSCTSISSNGLQISFNLSATTPFLYPPYVSGVINDKTDPAANLGIVLDIKENNKTLSSSEYNILAESDNINVVEKDHIIITKEEGKAIIKIIPSSVGYSNITVTITKNNKSASIVINYAASASSTERAYYHTGSSDASAAILLDKDYMVIGDDETNQLFVYHRTSSGLPVKSYNYASFLHLEDADDAGVREVDCEAATRSLKHPEIVYWTGSMSNGGKRFEEKPNRSQIFATVISGAGTETKFEFKGSYSKLRKYLIKWGDENGYHLSSAANYGEKPKQISGFNVEGIVFGPDSTTLYIGFRAPQVPVSNRTNALIAPLVNFEQWFNNGKPLSKPVIGKPIELNLDKRGIRDIIRLADNSYLIIAGNADAVRNTALYKWTGLATDVPVNLNIPGINSLAAEAAVELLDDGKPTGKIQLICDDGSTEWYNDGNAAKNLDGRFKKFRSMVISIVNP